jgi:hypothetical protein
MTEGSSEFGVIYTQNITQDKTYGIGSWTDGELVYLLRTGIKRDGKYAPPYMAKLPHLADEDMNAVISFLRSNDPLVTASATPTSPVTHPRCYEISVRGCFFKPFKMPTQKLICWIPIMRCSWVNTVYNLECLCCHSADYKTDNWKNRKKSKGYLGGGNKPLDREEGKR